jgi:hypothetical protein
MLRKNVSGQHLGFCLINATTGAALTGATVTVSRVIDGGTQATATGTVAEKGGCQYDFAPSQADTNGNQISFLFTAPGAIPVEKTIVTVTAAAVDIADAVLVRDASNVEALAPEHSLCGVILATTEWSIASTTWTILRSDGSTTFASKALTVTGGQITGVA